MERIVRCQLLPALLAVVFLAGCMDGGGMSRPRRQTDEEWIRSQMPLPRSGSNDPRDWNVHVEVQNLEASSASFDFGQVAWVYRGADATVGGGGPILANNGIRIGISSGRLSAGVVAGSGSTRTRQSTSQFLTVLNGRTAYLDVSNVYTEPMNIVILDHHLAVIGTHYFVKAGATLEVRPTIVRDDLLDVEVTPIISSYDQGTRRLALQELRTMVRIRDGQSIVIGGMETSRATFGSAFFSHSSAQGAVHRVVILTPTILK